MLIVTALIRAAPLRAMPRTVLLVLAASAAACDRNAEATPPDVTFTAETPREVILDHFPEILNWSPVRVDREMVLGQSRCVLTVAASDSSNAAAIRQAFLPVARESETVTCPAVVAVRLMPFTRATIALARARIDSLLAPHNVGARTRLTDLGTIVVEVKNFSAVARAEAALAPDAGIPAALVEAVRPRVWMREADHPQPPPLAAYTAILASQYWHAASSGTRVRVLRSTLPRSFTSRQLAGMPIEIVEEASAADYVIRFGRTGQLEDGVFTIGVAAGRGGAAPERPVGVDCIGNECFLVDVAPPGG